MTGLEFIQNPDSLQVQTVLQPAGCSTGLPGGKLVNKPCAG